MCLYMTCCMSLTCWQSCRAAVDLSHALDDVTITYMAESAEAMTEVEMLVLLQEKPLQPPHHPVLLKALAKELQCEPADIVDFELNLCDTVPGTIGGGLSSPLCWSLPLAFLIWPNVALLMVTAAPVGN